MTDSAKSSDDLREKLLDAAAEEFAEVGYSGARVATIADRAGVTTGAMYNRFSGKSELLLEALDRYTGNLLAELAAADLSASDVLSALGSELLITEESAAAMLILESFVAARREPEIAERLRPRLADERARLGKLVDEDKSGGAVDATVDTAAIVTFAQAVGLGMQLLKLIDAQMPEPAAWDQLLDRLISAFQLEQPTTETKVDGPRKDQTHGTN